MKLSIRAYRPTDEAFVIDAWKRSYEGALAVRGCDREHYRIEMSRTIGRILDKTTTTTLVACDPEDADTIVGFACYTRSTMLGPVELHYVYVKREFRKMGVARFMLEGIPVGSYTFLAPQAKPRKGWRFTPRFSI